MKAEIRKIDDNTWSLDEGGVRFFLLAGKDRALLIDSGMETRDAKELAKGLTDLPTELLNTHADMDHIGSNGEFEEVYMHLSEANNYYKNNNRTERIRPVWDGEILDLGERKLKIIHIPGHTPGSIAILDIEKRRLFSGDPVQDDKIFQFGPEREMHAYRLSLKRLMDMKGEFDELYPSHGTCPVMPSLIDRLYEAAGEIMEGKVEGEDIEMFGHRARLYDVGAAKLLCDAD